MSNDVAIVLVAPWRVGKAERGLAGAGRRLGGTLHAIAYGGSPEVASEIARFVDRVIVVEAEEYQPETAIAALAEVCRDIAPRAILFANDTYSQEIAPRLAHRLGGSAVGDGVELRAAGEALQVVRAVYGGKAQAVMTLKRTPAVAWLRARSFAPAEEGNRAGVILSVAKDPLPTSEGGPSPSEPVLRSDSDEGRLRMTLPRIVERSTETQSEARLEDARVIVAGGRGIGGPEGFRGELQPLAQLLGAQLAASRAACDAGWAPPTWQVGQTGKKVAPDLYLAIAITGASQHMAGVSEAKQIAAINTDPDAPIFKHCRFGIVEDYRKVVPLLRQKLAALQS